MYANLKGTEDNFFILLFRVKQICLTFCGSVHAPTAAQYTFVVEKFWMEHSRHLIQGCEKLMMTLGYYGIHDRRLGEDSGMV